MEIVIPGEYGGSRLDQVLARLLPEWSRSRLQAWIQEKRILVDNEEAIPRQKLRGGEKIQIAERHSHSAETTDAAEPVPLDIVYEDHAIIVINKPAGLVVHPGNGNRQGTLLNGLLHHAAQQSHIPRAGIVHRLDKNTSGLMVVAKTLQAQTNLVRQLQSRTVKREYQALVLGWVAADGKVDAPVGRHPVQRTKMTVTQRGKEARTRYQVMERFDECTLLRCSLETGRTHQIRVHMHAIGHPLVGDPIYGGNPRKTRLENAQLLAGFSRQALHAQRLALSHPDQETEMAWTAALPEDMDNLLRTLRGHFPNMLESPR